MGVHSQARLSDQVLTPLHGPSSQEYPKTQFDWNTLSMSDQDNQLVRNKHFRVRHRASMTWIIAQTQWTNECTVTPRHWLSNKWRLSKQCLICSLLLTHIFIGVVIERSRKNPRDTNVEQAVTCTCTYNAQLQTTDTLVIREINNEQ